MTLLYYSSPFGCLALLPLALAIEWNGFVAYVRALGCGETLLVLLLISVGGFLAFFLLLAELRIVQLASGLTLSIGGIFKEVLTVAASAIFLGDHLTPYNVGGLMLCLAGIATYNRIKLKEMAAEAKRGDNVQLLQQMDR